MVLSERVEKHTLLGAHRLVIGGVALAGFGLLVLVMTALKLAEVPSPHVTAVAPPKELATWPAGALPTVIPTAEQLPAEALVAQMLASGFDPLGASSLATSAAEDPTTTATAEHRALLVEAMRRQKQSATAETNDAIPPSTLPASTMSATGTSQPMAALSSTEPVPEQRSQAKRRASRALEQTAAELEDVGNYDEADAVRRVAERLRLDARGTVVR